MAYRVGAEEAISQRAASQVNSCVAVIYSASQADYVLTAASSMAQAQEPVGLSIATAASPGDPIAIQTEGIGKAIAAASIGVGGRAVVASSNGALGPVGASPAAWTVGVARTAAAAGEYFSVLIDPEKVGN